MFNFRKNTQAQKGVTLIELIVVTAIIAILSGVFFINYRSSQQGYTLDLAARELVSDIRWAQNAAMSGLRQGNNSVYGYGVYIPDTLNINSYVVFYNETSGDGETYNNLSPTSNKIRTINLSNSVTINQTAKGANIFFVPPDPTTYISVISPVDIVLSRDGSIETETVTVSDSGLIEY